MGDNYNISRLPSFLAANLTTVKERIMAIEMSSQFNSHTTHYIDHPYLMAVARRPEVIFACGKGDYLFDTEGSQYLDFVQGWAVNCLGHSPVVLQKALAEQAGQLWNPSPAYFNEPLLELARSLTVACEMDQVFFANSGAEANEGAIKLARKWAQLNKPEGNQIITTAGSFHGRTLATMSASGKAAFEPLFEPKIAGFIKVPFNDIAAMAAAIGSNTIAVMLEPIQGEAGVIAADNLYMKALEKLCRERNVLLILDEIQTGMGRTGPLLAAQGYGIQADIVTLGKGLGGGAPISALLANNALCCFQPGDQGSTFGGNPLLAAVASAVLAQVNSSEFQKRIEQSGEKLKQGLESVYGVGSVRGRGLLLAVDIPAGNASALVLKALEHKLLINAPNDHCLRFMPALTVQHSSIDSVIALLAEMGLD